MDNIQRKTPNYTFALIVVFAVLFLIGFITTMNNSMIDFCKKAFNLKDAQGQLVNTAFYGAYALSIPFGLLMNKIGYKKTLLLGLAVVGIGFIINYLGISSMLGMSTSVIYSVFLGSMFIVALGIVMLQLVANPYVMVLGSPEKGAFRMTLANALNSAATTVAPVFITYVIIAGKVPTPDAVPGPYLGLGIFTLILCAVLFFLKLPNINEGEQAEELTGEKKEYKDTVFQYPHVWLGMLGIFFYMGIELGVPSMLPAYFKSNPELAQYGSPTDFLPYYWGSMMVGRFAGAIILNKFKPRKILSVCLVCGALCVASSFALSGIASVYAMLAAGLFHSVMWPLVFNLGLQELGPHTKAASGIINLGVVGGATLPLLMGFIVDSPALGVGYAVAMMFVYYVYVFWFCNFGSKIGLSK
ncbi:glucose/galactose MFS transporter [Prevotella sp.]|mgnify:FL=1|uniref:glucose/galactose MFS transporter n=1 Tax=uncultured Prevotella sp. TaxID=159272 RepID=UPI00260DF0E5|nr:glucose/galactose MFS transporter [uncultured Prevotella sp.]